MSQEPLVLRTLDAPDPRWDAFVRSHPQGSFFHLSAWRRVIQRAFPGHAPHYLYAARGDQILGVLPLFASGGRPFSRALVSVPIGVQGGVLSADAAAAALLREGARAIALRERLPYIEYKSELPVFEDLPSKDSLYFVFRQELFEDREKQLAAIPRKTRAVLREAERAHLEGRYNRDDLEAFYDLYALSMRNLGTPMFPKELFVASLEELGPSCEFVTVRECGRIIGCVMNYYYGDVMLPFFAGTVPEARDVGINHWIYWFMMETGFHRGYRVFDFGRSKAGTGAFKFKKHFGMQEQPLAYQYELVGAEALPNVNPTNPKYARAIAAWQKLPVELTKWVGPLIQRRLP